jgi:hypothetical protein
MNKRGIDTATLLTTLYALIRSKLVFVLPSSPFTLLFHDGFREIELSERLDPLLLIDNVSSMSKMNANWSSVIVSSSRRRYLASPRATEPGTP